MREIVTARLALRPITAEDVQAVVGGQRRSDWAGDFPAEGDQVIARLLARTGMPADDARRFGHRLVVERDTDTVVGGIGFFGPPRDGEVEIGYGIVPSRQRCGYATEAVQAMVADILPLDGIQTVTAHVDLDNLASIQVLQKCGMTFCARNSKKPLTTFAGPHRTKPRALPDSGLRGQAWGNVTTVRIRRDGAAR